MRFYEVGKDDPTDPRFHYFQDAEGRFYATGESVLTRQTSTKITLGKVNVPEHHLYLAEEDPRQPGQYERETDLTTAWKAGATPADHRVQETKTIEKIPIDELYNEKLDELNRHYTTVRFASCDLSGNGGGDNWALVLHEQARANIQAVHAFLTSRDGKRGQTFEDAALAAVDFAAYKTNLSSLIPRWPPSQVAIVSIRNKSTLEDRTYSIGNIDDWDDIIKDMGEFDTQCNNAWVDCEQDLDAYRDAGDSDSLAAVDVKSYAWPPSW